MWLDWNRRETGFANHSTLALSLRQRREEAGGVCFGRLLLPLLLLPLLLLSVLPVLLVLWCWWW